MPLSFHLFSTPKDTSCKRLHAPFLLLVNLFLHLTPHLSLIAHSQYLRAHPMLLIPHPSRLSKSAGHLRQVVVKSSSCHRHVLVMSSSSQLDTCVKSSSLSPHISVTLHPIQLDIAHTIFLTSGLLLLFLCFYCFFI